MFCPFGTELAGAQDSFHLRVFHDLLCGAANAPSFFCPHARVLPLTISECKEMPVDYSREYYGEITPPQNEYASLGKAYIKAFFDELHDALHHVYAIFSHLDHPRFGIVRLYDYVAFQCNLERKYETHRFTLNEFYACYEILHPADTFSILFHGDAIYYEHELTRKTFERRYQKFLEFYCERGLRRNEAICLTSMEVEQYGFSEQDAAIVGKDLEKYNTAAIEKLQREYNALVLLDCIEKIDVLFMKNQINTPCERLREVVQQSGHSVNGLAKELGLRHGENLYQILKGKNGISLNVAQRIHALYPEYSVGWLLCGDVDTVPYSCDDKTVIRIPVHRDLWSEEFSPEKMPAENIVLSAEAANGAEFAVPYMDDILNPFLRNSLMLLRKHRDGEVLYGNIYLVITERFRLFRIVHKDRRHPENLRLKTLLPAEYDDIIVRRDQVKAMCFVCGAICRMGV